MLDPIDGIRCRAKTLMAAVVRLVTLMLVAGTGCSSDRIPTYSVRGQVVFTDGSLVKTGIVEFTSIEHGLNARSVIGRDGSFTLGTYSDADGAVAGKHRAIVVQFLASEADPDIVHDHGDTVDRRFAAYESSGLEFEVAAKAENILRIVVEKQVE